jgi:hypothetical protein
VTRNITVVKAAPKHAGWRGRACPWEVIASESSIRPVAAVLANAVFDATGVLPRR